MDIFSKSEVLKKLNEIDEQIEKFLKLSKEEKLNVSHIIVALKKKREYYYNSLDSWDKTALARHPDRPVFQDYLKELFTEFYELHGDRLYADDPAIICGIGEFKGRSVFVIGQEKGKDTGEKIYRNFGMAHPEGYRKSLRIMKLAEKFKKPVLIFVDTPGAYPGIGAEERGQALAIADNIIKMVALKTPTIAVIIGEGGSGGALALASADRVLMLENAIYSVISPEGCAAILWRDAMKAKEAALALKISAQDLYERGFIDEIINEPAPGAHVKKKETYAVVAESIEKHLNEIESMDLKELLERRYARYKNMGVFKELL